MLEAAKDSAEAHEAAEVPPGFGERLNESARAAGEAAREGWERTRGATVAVTGATVTATVTAVTGAGAAIGRAVNSRTKPPQSVETHSSFHVFYMSPRPMFMIRSYETRGL